MRCEIWQVALLSLIVLLMGTGVAIASGELLAQNETPASLSQTLDVARVGNSVVNVDGPTAGTVDTPYDSSINVTVRNLLEPAVDMHNVVINEAAGTEVILTGPESGMTNTPYTFTAVISPTSASVPITYTFEASDGLGPTSGTFNHTNPINWQNVLWSMPGAKTVMVTAQNAEGTYTDTHSIEIESGTVFLPLVLNDYTPPFVPSESIPWNYTIMKVPEAWASSTGQGIVIADVGTGVDLDHPDLEDNVIGGYDFVDDDTTPDDKLGDGSFIAGVIAGVANNGGIVGIAPNGKIMPIKVYGSDGTATYADIAAGITWADDNGANIINLSFIFTQQSGTVEGAIEDVYGSLIFAMVGDCGGTDYADHGCTMENQYAWPARYAVADGIGSTNSSDQLSDFSSEAQPLVVAPGEGIYSAGLDGGYAADSSTGYASAHAAGVAALVWAANPTYSTGEVRGAIHHSAVDLGLSIPAQGQGRIDAAAAITQDPYGGWLKTDADATQSAAPPDICSQQTTTMIEDEVLVKLSDGASLSRVWSQAGFRLSKLQVLDVIDGLNIYRLSVPADQRTDIIDSLLQTPGVEFAEPNYLVTLK